MFQYAREVMWINPYLYGQGGSTPLSFSHDLEGRKHKIQQTGKLRISAVN